jgi:hypothetical protein
MIRPGCRTKEEKGSHASAATGALCGHLGARWELRLGPDNRFRVFYRVEAEARRVRILAIAVKERNRIFLAGEEVEL